MYYSCPILTVSRFILDLINSLSLLYFVLSPQIWFRLQSCQRLSGGEKWASHRAGSGEFLAGKSRLTQIRAHRRRRRDGVPSNLGTAPTVRRRRPSYVRLTKARRRRQSSPYISEAIDPNKHAIAVAAATAAVAEAAVAAARAAAEVVKLTSGGARSAPTAYVSGIDRHREVLSAVKIQSAFRGYLARRALRALKALVKLQALVRGHIVRKQTADMLRRMQALVRVQTRARASRTHVSKSSNASSKSSLSHHPDSASLDKYKHELRANSTKFDQSSILKVQRCGSNSNIRDVRLDKAHMGSNWLDRWMEECSWNDLKDRSRKTYADDERSDKILEVDTWKPHLNSKRSTRTFQTPQHVLASDYNNRNHMAFESLSKHTTKAQKSAPSLSSGEALSLNSLMFPVEVDKAALWTSENSPQVFSASSRPGSSGGRGPFTPTRSEYSRSFFSGYSDHPNYMANTQSYRAKVRSQSAPRQRIEFDKSGLTRRSVHGFSDAATNSYRGSALHADLTNKAYPFSQLERLKSGNLRPFNFLLAYNDLLPSLSYYRFEER
ncbi:hypothetical protein L1049_019926 [Liquidambar formosana]|uniref:DUF4005 domain-containing protein n=1 Tax=Liquidambar formosana TaxID=63359 RepID=A0AAP0SAJ6_LIQFO